QAGHADGLSYVLTKDDPFGAIDLDHCRDKLCSIDVWAQNFMQAAVHSYQEVTPSGEGIRIWGLADGNPINTKFTLDMDGKKIAAELFRRTNKALTITGYTLNPAIHELANVDNVFSWAVVWGERRKAEMIKAAPIGGNGFDGSGCQYSLDEIERIVREGAPPGTNRSDVFHAIIGHYVGCGWQADRIFEHLQQFPGGICSRYVAENRLRQEIDRSAGKYTKAKLPLSGGNGGWAGWEPKAPPRPEPKEAPTLEQPHQESDEADPDIEHNEHDAEVDDDQADDDEVDDDDVEGVPEQDLNLPPLHAHGDPDSRPLKTWLIKQQIPAVGHGLLSGQWGTGKTFVFFDLAASLI